MSAGVRQAAHLFQVISFLPVKLPALNGEWKGNVQVDQDVRIGQAFPHILNKRMLLGNVPGMDASLLQSLDQSSFTSRAWPDHAHKGKVLRIV